MFWKTYILTFWPPRPGRGVCGGNICYHVAAFVIPFNLIYNMTMFGKINFDIWPTPRVCLWLEGSGGKIFATTFLHSWFNLICNLTMFLKSWILTFWSQGQGIGVSGALRSKYLLPWCCIHDSLKIDMQNDHVRKKLNFDVFTPLPKSTQGVGHRYSIKNHVWYVS